jgi:hypothetical protein
METVVALVVDQERVAVFPPVMVVGEAESVAVGAAVCTVTVAAALAVPALPVAVRVYCVVAEGVTVVDPDAATVPIPGAIETEVALAVVQVSVAGFPATTDEGAAERVAVGAFTTVKLMVAKVDCPHLSHSWMTVWLYPGFRVNAVLIWAAPWELYTWTLLT